MKVPQSEWLRECEEAKAEFTVLPNGRTTICSLTLHNGFTIIGQSTCAQIEDFDAALGAKLSRDDAEKQVWGYLGFRLHDKLRGVSVDYDQLYDEATEYVLVEGETERRIILGATFSEAGKKLKFMFEPAPTPAVH